MQATRITLKTVPLVAVEMRRLIEGIAALRQRIGGGDMEALEQLAQLTAQVRQQLPQLRQFCSQNEEEPGVSFLSPLVSRLSRMAEGPVVSKINESYNEVPWKATREKEAIKTSTASSRLSVSPRKESTPTRSRAKKQNRPVTVNENKPIAKKESKSINQQASASRKSQKSQMRKSIVKPKQEQEKQEGQHQDMEISFNNGAIFVGGDTLLTLKLSRQQYTEVIRLKKQQGHLP